ncbi:MAG: hypothetical protein JO332_04460, partial [Planctomycetaceae bacterium]|nr:hypothetical protein [Planctomycetaceae bacterium]
MPKVTCDCGARLTAPDTLAGKLVKCPKCAGPVLVPAVAEPELDLLPAAPPPPAATRGDFVPSYSAPKQPAPPPSAP